MYSLHEFVFPFFETPFFKLWVQFPLFVIFQLIIFINDLLGPLVADLGDNFVSVVLHEVLLRAKLKHVLQFLIGKWMLNFLKLLLQGRRLIKFLVWLLWSCLLLWDHLLLCLLRASWLFSLRRLLPIGLWRSLLLLSLLALWFLWILLFSRLLLLFGGRWLGVLLRLLALLGLCLLLWFLRGHVHRKNGIKGLGIFSFLF